MITFLLIALIVVLVPAIAALVHAVHRAADGYEDELQFHAGACPRSAAAIPASSSVPNWIEGPRPERLPQLAANDPAKA